MRSTTKISRLWLLPALAAVMAAAPVSRLPAPTADFGADPTRAALVSEALSRRPEVAQAAALAQAEVHRVGSSNSFPDPTAGFGVQSDVAEWTVGEEETSYYILSLSQTFPRQGKRGLRQQSARARRQWAQANADRVRLSTVAEVERAYLDLLLARGRLGLQERLESVWKDAEAAARVRYETGLGTQADYLRAQLERNRLRQRRYQLEAAERSAVAVINRLRVAEPDATVATPVELAAFVDPPVPETKAAVDEAEAKSPELVAARALVEEAGREVEIARKNLLPDLTVNATLMPRGGDWGTMYQVGVSAPLPVWADSKQSELLAESDQRLTATRRAEEGIRLLLRQRVCERLAALDAAVQSNLLYRDGLLTQSEAAARSVLALYRTGGAPFVSVLEAWSGYLADVDGYLQSVAAARKVQAQMDEVSLDPVGGGNSVPAAPGAGLPGAPPPVSQGGESAGAAGGM